MALLQTGVSAPGSYGVLEEISNNADYIPLCFDVMMAPQYCQDWRVTVSLIFKLIISKLRERGEKCVGLMLPWKNAMFQLMFEQPFDVSSVFDCYQTMCWLGREKIEGTYDAAEDICAMVNQAYSLLAQAQDIQTICRAFELVCYLNEVRDLCPALRVQSIEWYCRFSQAALPIVTLETLMNPEFRNVYGLFSRFIERIAPEVMECLGKDALMWRIAEVLGMLGDVKVPIGDEAVRTMVLSLCATLVDVLTKNNGCEELAEEIAPCIAILCKTALNVRMLFPCDRYLSILAALLRILWVHRRFYSEEHLEMLCSIALTAIPMSVPIEELENPELIYEDVFECESQASDDLSSARGLGLRFLNYFCEINFNRVIAFLLANKDKLDMESTLRVWSEISRFVFVHRIRNPPPEYVATVTTLMSFEAPVDDFLSLSVIFLRANSCFLCDLNSIRSLEASGSLLLENQSDFAFLFQSVGYFVIERLCQVRYPLSIETLQKVCVANSARIGFEQLSILNYLSNKGGKELQALSGLIQDFLLKMLREYGDDCTEFYLELSNGFSCLCNFVRSPDSVVDMRSLTEFLLWCFSENCCEEVTKCSFVVVNTILRDLPSYPQLLAELLNVETAFFCFMDFCAPEFELVYGAFITERRDEFIQWPEREHLLRKILEILRDECASDDLTNYVYMGMLLCQIILLKQVPPDLLAGILEDVMSELMNAEDEDPLRNLMDIDVIASVAQTTDMVLPEPVVQRWYGIVQSGMVLNDDDLAFHLGALSYYARSRQIALPQIQVMEGNFLESMYDVFEETPPNPLVNPAGIC